MNIIGIFDCPYCGDLKKSNSECHIDLMMVLPHRIKYFLIHDLCHKQFQIDVSINSFVTIKEGVYIDIQNRKENDYLR